MRILLPLLLIALLAGLTVWMLKGGDDPDGARGTDDGPTASLEVTLARDRVAAMVAATDYAAARRVLAPLVAGDGAALRDLLTAAVVELKDGDAGAAAGFVARARELDANAAAVQYLAGRLAELSPAGTEAAIDHYRSANQLAPDDLPTRYLLGMNLEYLGDDDAIDEAFTWYESVETVGIEMGGPWFVSAIYRLSQMHQFYGEDAEVERRYVDLWAALQRQGLRAVKAVELAEGELARVRPPAAIGNLASAPVAAPAYDGHETILPELGGGQELLAADLTGNRQVDLVAAGPNGIVVALRTQDGGWRINRVTDEPARLVRAIDLFQDDRIDLIYLSGASLRLLECSGALDEETWTPTPLTLPILPSAPTDFELVDFDHDGDLDLFLVGDFGGRLLRNDGAGALGEPTGPDEEGPRERLGGFVDASQGAGLPTQGDWVWCASEDFDGDQDVDLIMGGPGLLWAGSSLRSGAFEDVSGTLFAGESLDSEPLLADLDGDARMDAVLPGSPARVLLQTSDGRMRGSDANFDLPAGAHAIEVDIDLDGTVDALWASEGLAARGVLALSLEQETTVDFGRHTGSGPLVVADLESGYAERLDWELLRLESDGVHVFRTDAPVGNAVRLRFRGQKDNRQGIGAVVELRAGPLYRRHYWRGTSTLYGLGSAEFFDVVRITWPNGVIGYEQDLKRGNQILEGTAGFGIQQEGLPGSCPFLYTWNGETHEFITDVLGITPLGLPMAPGLLVPPDHDEYVLVRGEQLVPKDGRLILQFTEELREVTYLDRIRLDVVDHPADTELFPNERFCFPPFPEARSHVVQPIPPTRVTGSDGEDWTAALAAIDDVHAAPFVPLKSLQFQGLAEPHWLELAFDAEDLIGARELRLVCTGWFYWTDASVNLAAARTPGVAFIPPTIEVPGEDGWVPAGPPVGFPAGKSKTMVLDVTDILRAEDPRLRISSTLRLYWDSIRLVVKADGPQVTTPLEPVAAKLWPRGLSAPVETDRADLPERFVWENLEKLPRWDQHPGNYTRYGEVLPLLGAADDRYAIMGTGDALTVEFDATELPPVPEGWRRDYLVYLVGWAKDRDPNTVQALEVEPLPFHGMSGYPYGAHESFPDTPEHRAWRAEWNTRPAYRHAVPLSPARLREWIAETAPHASH